MAPSVALDRVQRWMQAVIMAPGTDEEAIASRTAQAEVPLPESRSVVLPSRTLTATERVGIYRDMYLVRLRDALESDYPGVAHFLGEERFRKLVADYVGAHPSSSYTLNRLGDHFPEYLRAAAVPRREFVFDLARLELGVTEAFDADETAPLPPQAIASVPAEAWARARLVPIAAFRLLAFHYPVSAYLQSVKDGTPHPSTRRRDTWVAVYRRNYALSRLDLSREAYRLLSALASGSSLGDAVQSVVAGAQPRRVAEEHLFRWFREWVAEGIFRRVELK
jgi:hypothetical protein